MGGLKRGGLEAFAMNMYRSVDRTQIQFDFLLTQVMDGDYEEEAKSMGANIYHLPPRNKGYFAYENAIKEFFFLHSSEYSACHLHASSLTSIGPLHYARKYGIPIRVLHSHNSTISHDLRFRPLHIVSHYIHKPFVKLWATHYLGCSDKALDWMYKYTGIRDKAQMCNNGINVDIYTYNENSRFKIRNEFCISEKELLLGHVGRFEHVKNQSFLLDILASLISNGINAKLMLVGTGPLLESIQLMAKEKCIEDKVIFTGVRPDVNILMQAMDIFVMPSLFEGLPVTLVEAQSSGLPIVASDTISKNSDLTGTIVFKSLNENSDSWAKIIQDLTFSKKRYDNALKIKYAGFDSNTTMKQLVKIYSNV